MPRERNGRLVAAFTGLVTVLSPLSASAADDGGKKGLALAKKHDCLGAIPLLEDAELNHHRPTTSLALGLCYVETGQLIRADDSLRALANERPVKGWTRADSNAQATAKKKADEIDARIPTITFVGTDKFERLEVWVNDIKVADATAEKKIAPDVQIAVRARAKGYEEWETKLTLSEGEHKEVRLRMKKREKAAGAGTGEGEGTGETPKGDGSEDDKDKTKEGDKDKKRPSYIGVRYRGVVIPQFLMNAFVDGGTTLVVPGGAITYTTPASDADVTFSLGWMSYSMGDTAMKAKNTPDTEWEFVSSSLQSIIASVDLNWNVPLDNKGDWIFRIGGGVGVGVTLGSLSRVQSYPKDLKPGDPSNYLECKGPNNPIGTFRYCNSLDKDANHYPGYSEPNWFQGGVRPLIYPWVVLPELGISYKASPSVILDLETGVSISGILTSFGIRYAL